MYWNLSNALFICFHFVVVMDLGNSYGLMYAFLMCIMAAFGRGIEFSLGQSSGIRIESVTLRIS